MRNQSWILAILLVFGLALTACNAMPGAQVEEQAASAQPLDPATWPTPQPSPTLASPTPFPKITLGPDAQPSNGTATPTPNATIASSASAASLDDVETEGFSFTGNLGDLMQQVTDLSGGFPPVAAGTVKTADTTVRQGPADTYAALGLVEQGEMAAVLGKSDAGDWLYVLTRTALQGWLPTDALQITLSLGAAPVLPPDPPRTGRQGRLAQKPPQAVEAASGLTSLLGAYEPVAVALVTAKGVTLRQGPAASFPAAEGVEQGELAGVLGTNAGKDWLYVITITGVQGWLSADNLRVMGSLAEAAVLPANPLAAAPVAPVSPSASAANPSGSAPGVAGSQPLPIAELAPVATAQVDNDSLNLRQGPGAAYQLIGTLTRDTQVSVLALNKTGDWTLVKTSDGRFGWVSLNYLAVDGSLADAPHVISPAPSRILPPGQVAPIFPSSADMGSSSQVPLAPEPPSTAENAVSGQPASAASRPGTVVLQLSSGGDIVSINPDGTGLRRLTQGIDPVLSPDGQTVAFTRWTGEDGTLWLIGVDGGHERAVLGETKQAKHPSWSPDGQRLVVNFQHGGRLDPKQICENLIKLGNNNPGIPFNVDPDTVEVKLKDGQPYLCWTLPPDPHWGLRVVKVTDGSYEDMPSDSYAFSPEWDPATPWRVVSSGLNGLIQLDVNRAAQWALTSQGEDHTPAFSPDGRYIAVAFNNNGQYDIHRLNSDGNGRVALTKTPLWVTAEPGEQKPWNNVAPAWSPDGSQIAFLSDRSGRWEIWVMNADGSEQRPMFSDQVNNQLDIHYDFVDERVLSWR